MYSKANKVSETVLIADIHGIPVATIQNSYAKNSEYFIDKEDVYLIDFHEYTFRRGFEIPPRGMRVFIESGYLSRHVTDCRSPSRCQGLRKFRNPPPPWSF